MSTRELLPVGNAAWRVSGTVDVYDLDSFLALCVCLFVSYSTGIRRRRMEFGRRNQGRLVLGVALQFILFVSSPLCVLNYLRYELLPVAWALPTLGRPPASWAASRPSSRLILQVLCAPLSSNSAVDIPSIRLDKNNREPNRNNRNRN